MIANFNIGLLGHVDSGKTTLARALSAIASTAAFDKNSQSQKRGITLDLGFSGLLLPAPQVLKDANPLIEQLQFTFVDCPGHASLIRTIIGGAQIIDLMVLVIDAQKGIQTQTAECIVIGELLCKKLIVVINKIDLLNIETKENQLQKLSNRLRKTLANTNFGADVKIFNVSAQERLNLKELLAGLCDAYYKPERLADLPLMVYVDHCFFIKGQGTVCTGTIIQGSVAVGDTIELPTLGEKRKVKSIQMFHRPVDKAKMGDRVGICVTQLNANLLERSVLAEPGYLNPIQAVCIRLQRIKYYNQPIKSKTKLHISVGHDTVMANIILFRDLRTTNNSSEKFDSSKEYEYIDELITEPGDMQNETIFALLEFEMPVMTTSNAILIASKLDMDIHSSMCRLAFWGNILWLTADSDYANKQLSGWKVFKRKLKEGIVQRVVNQNELIVQNIFKKVTNRDMYVGKTVELSTGEIGRIEGTFGQTSKVRAFFPDGIQTTTLDLLKTSYSSVKVLLKFKKYVFNKQLSLVQ